MGERGTEKENPQKWLVTMEKWSQVLMFLMSKWSVVVNAVMVAEVHWSQSTSISFVPGFVCWLPFVSPFPSAPCLAVGPLWAPLFWSFTSGASSTVGFGLLMTGLHTSSSSWWVREKHLLAKEKTQILSLQLKARIKSEIVLHIPVFWLWCLLL